MFNSWIPAWNQQQMSISATELWHTSPHCTLDTFLLGITDATTFVDPCCYRHNYVTLTLQSPSQNMMWSIKNFQHSQHPHHIIKEQVQFLSFNNKFLLPFQHWELKQPKKWITHQEKCNQCKHNTIQSHRSNFDLYVDPNAIGQLVNWTILEFQRTPSGKQQQINFGTGSPWLKTTTHQEETWTPPASHSNFKH